MSAIEKDNAGAQAADVSHEEIAKPNYGQGGGDEALKALDGDDEVYSEEEYAAVRRKIDWRITPVLFLINMIQLVDKNVSEHTCPSRECCSDRWPPDSWFRGHVRPYTASQSQGHRLLDADNAVLPWISGKLSLQALPVPRQLLIFEQVAEYPSTWLMQKCPTGKYLMANFIIWGRYSPALLA